MSAIRGAKCRKYNIRWRAPTVISRMPFGTSLKGMSCVILGFTSSEFSCGHRPGLRTADCLSLLLSLEVADGGALRDDVFNNRWYPSPTTSLLGRGGGGCTRVGLLPVVLVGAHDDGDGSSRIELNICCLVLLAVPPHRCEMLLTEPSLRGVNSLVRAELSFHVHSLSPSHLDRCPLNETKKQKDKNGDVCAAVLGSATSRSLCIHLRSPTV